MGKNNSAVTSSVWTAADKTVKATAGLFWGMQMLGSADATTYTVLDGTTSKFVYVVATTGMSSIAFDAPVAFSNSIVIDITGTGSYAVQYV